MKKNILVTGGCRSGKSGYAIKQGELLPAERRLFIATSVPRDEEMEQRVEKHRQERRGRWQTIEEPVDIDRVIIEHSRPDTVMLVDCLTLWISNLMEREHEINSIEKRVDQLVSALAKARGTVILVSNEVGSGIVPENRLARLFRDAVGWMNQRVAEACDVVVLTVAGLPVTLKPGMEASL